MKYRLPVKEVIYEEDSRYGIVLVLESGRHLRMGVYRSAAAAFEHAKIMEGTN